MAQAYENKFSNANKLMRDSGNFVADESINQRDFDDLDLGGDSGNLQKLGLGGKFGQLAGTETVKARKRYQSSTEQI